MKILVNSYPRSGSSTFVNALHRATGQQNIKWSDISFYGNDWIAKSHIPIIFFADFPKDISICTILRNPLDCISSNVFRWSNGYTGNIVKGKIVVDMELARKENKFDSTLKDLILHQVKQYIAYYSALANNYNNFTIFEYQDIKENAIPYIRQIIKDAKGDFINIDIDGISYAMSHPNLPTKEKTNLYYEIKDYIKLLPELKECELLYNNLIKFKNLGILI